MRGCGERVWCEDVVRRCGARVWCEGVVRGCGARVWCVVRRFGVRGCGEGVGCVVRGCRVGAWCDGLVCGMVRGVVRGCGEAGATKPQWWKPFAHDSVERQQQLFQEEGSSYYLI